ncbi:MAG: hypothetical protein JWL83_728 [Actinomycetia bacterium]|nr:hypothetical protein [Actinomycetes bacterium]
MSGTNSRICQLRVRAEFGQYPGSHGPATKSVPGSYLEGCKLDTARVFAQVTAL